MAGWRMPGLVQQNAPRFQLLLSQSLLQLPML
jgi:hypothetical protein